MTHVHTHTHAHTHTHTQGNDENVRANLRQYGLESRYVDMMVADAAKCVWKEQEIFDAIVTDREQVIERERERERDTRTRGRLIQPPSPPHMMAEFIALIMCSL